MKKTILLALLTSTLFASSVVTTPDGKRVLLKDDGTYEEINVVNKDGKDVALKQDGTWEEVKMSKKEDSTNPFENAALVKQLQGTWRSSDGDFHYEIGAKEIKMVTKERTSGRTKIQTEKHNYSINDVDESEKIVELYLGDSLNIGGFLSVGGKSLKLKFLDADTIQDISAFNHNLHEVILSRK